MINRSRYVEDLHGGDQQNWHKRAVGLNRDQFEKLMDTIEAEGTGLWSHKPAPWPETEQMLVDIPDGYYLFFFEDASDLQNINSRWLSGVGEKNEAKLLPGVPGGCPSFVEAKSIRSAVPLTLWKH